jgi:hypothetical protein
MSTTSIFSSSTTFADRVSDARSKWQAASAVVDAAKAARRDARANADTVHKAELHTLKAALEEINKMNVPAIERLALIRALK